MSFMEKSIGNDADCPKTEPFAVWPSQAPSPAAELPQGEKAPFRLAIHCPATGPRMERKIGSDPITMQDSRQHEIPGRVDGKEAFAK